jgi:hypothetical protein
MDPDDPATQAQDKTQKGLSKLKQQKSPSTTNTHPVQHSPKNLTELPAELLLIVCRAVSEQVINGRRVRDRLQDLLPLQDLVHLGQTCKTLHHVAQAVLYRDVVAGHRRYNGKWIISASTSVIWYV